MPDRTSPAARAAKPEPPGTSAAGDRLDRQVAPNLVDRLLLRMGGVQLPQKIFFVLSLRGELDPAMLEASLEDVLRESPILRTTAREHAWGFERRVTFAPVASTFMTRWPTVDPVREADLIRRPLDLAEAPPLAICAQGLGGATPRLAIMLHHSVSDASGAAYFIDRWARCYSQRCAGLHPEPPDSPPSRSYGQLLRALRWSDRLKVALHAAATLREQLEALGGASYATFNDRPLPGQDELSWQSLAIEPEALTGLKSWCAEHGGTVTDALLAALMTVSCRLWPPPPGRPIRIQLPVSLRQGAPVDVANRVAEIPLRLQPQDCRTFEMAWEAVRQASRRARDREQVVARAFEWLLVSYLPPFLVRRVLGAQLSMRRNATLSLVFSNLGTLDPMPHPFGETTLSGCAFFATVTSPPGIGVWVNTTGGRLCLTVSYHSPQVAHDQVRALCDGVRETVAGLSG